MFMQTNPFRPPISESPPEPGDVLSKPVFIGVSIGAGAAYIAMSLSGLAFVWYLSLSGTPMADLYRRAYASVPYLLFAHAEGFASMAIGGYWAARTAERRAGLAALIAGAIYALFVLLQYSTPYSWPIPFWSRALSVVLPLPGYLLGARFASRPS